MYIKNSVVGRHQLLNASAISVIGSYNTFKLMVHIIKVISAILLSFKTDVANSPVILRE